jgi:hypothetical protein
MVLAIYQIILHLNKITECLKMTTFKIVFTFDVFFLVRVNTVNRYIGKSIISTKTDNTILNLQVCRINFCTDLNNKVFNSSLISLHHCLTIQAVQIPVGSFYNIGDRKTIIIRTKLRHTCRCSGLNADLYRVNLKNDPRMLIMRKTKIKYP